MAVVKVGAIHEYTGLSTDTKPTTGVPAGSVFWELTTGTPNEVKKWVYNGSAWGLVVETAAT